MSAHLKPEQIHMLRTVRQPDSYYAAMWNKDPRTIQRARIGDAHANHPTAPERRVPGVFRP